MSKPIVKLTWEECRKRAVRMTHPDDFQAHSRKQKVYGVPRGGVVAALLVPEYFELVDHPREAEIIVDDIIASGKTRELYAANYPETPFLALVDFTSYDQELAAAQSWIQFPWEKDEQGGAEENVRRILQALGENPDRAGLLETPARYMRALKELTAGLGTDPKEHLKKSFALDDVDDAPSAYDDIILSDHLPFVSLCEHHLLPFSGVAHIGYLPQKLEPPDKPPVVGLSKLARLLDGYAQRPQVQERLTRQIADAIEEVLAPSGVGVILKATHTCQCYRGVKKAGQMTTSAMLGCFRDSASARQEFLALIAL